MTTNCFRSFPKSFSSIVKCMSLMTILILILNKRCFNLRHRTYAVCPSPNMVDNANPSVMNSPWLVGDVFSYVCVGSLVIIGTGVNECSASGISTEWSLTVAQGNLPVCGKMFWHVLHISVAAYLREFFF